MKYTHEFTVNAGLDAVVDFHRRSASMGAITPPPIVVKVHEAPAILEPGDRMAFTMWLGPLPIRWVARIDRLDGPGFIDRQEEGPFARWEHRHIFQVVDEQTTVVRDEVEVELHPSNWFWRVVGFNMWLGLPVLFAFRGWKTRRILESAAVSAPS